MRQVRSGLDRLGNDAHLQKHIVGTVGYLCHAASVDGALRHGLHRMKSVFGDRLKAVFSPQHGLYGSDQDNMIETGHSTHAYFDTPVFSLYSDTRVPTEAMLESIDNMVIDLQDVGSRIYTYIYTMILTMEACGKQDIKIWILDRPNPINGHTIEGNVLDPAFRSFVGLYPLPMRHGLTIGEVAAMAVQYWGVSCEYEVVKMQGWTRAMHFENTGLPWVMPSPNMPNTDTAWLYPGTVLLEGTGLSEGRGTTKSLELVGHPSIEPYAMTGDMEAALSSAGLSGFVLRPLFFKPVAQKYVDRDCGGWQIHITDREALRPWMMMQVMLRELYGLMGEAFTWRPPPYEYEHEKLPIDILNGTDSLRKWVESKGDVETLYQIESIGRAEYLEKKAHIALYP